MAAQWAVSNQKVMQGMPTVVTAATLPSSVGFIARQQKAMKVLSTLQCITGLSFIIINTVLLCLRRQDADYIGSGIWCGALCLVSGILGLVAAKRNRAGLIISTMVMSIISCSLLIVVIGGTSIGMAAKPIDCDVRYGDDPYYCFSQGKFPGYVAADSLMIIFAIAEFVVTLWTSILCCKGVCSSCCGPIPYGYNIQPTVYSCGQAVGQQVIFLPSSGFAGGQQVVMLASQQSQPTGQMLLTQPLLPYGFQASSATEMQGTRPPAHELGFAQANPDHTLDVGDVCKQPKAM